MGHVIFIAIPVCLAFLAELIFAGAKNSSLVAFFRRFQTTHLADLACFVAYGLGFFQTAVFVGSFGVGIIFLWAANALWNGLLLAHRFDPHNAALAAGLYFVTASFLAYWSHRAFHQGWLWNFHRFHHSATDMNPLGQHRNHPMQHAITGGLFALPSLMIKVDPAYIVVLGLIHQTHQLVTHSNIRSDWGWFGRWVLVSPAAHRLHHSIEVRHHDRNFADDLIIWDRLFGTWCDDSAGVTDLGVTDVAYNHRGPIYDVLADYVRAIRQGYMRAKERLIAAVSKVRKAAVNVPPAPC